MNRAPRGAVAFCIVGAGIVCRLDWMTEIHAAPTRIFNVTSLSALRQKVNSARPGDEIRLASGLYNSQEPIAVRRSGTARLPIVIAAGQTGQAQLAGRACFEFLDGASHIVIRGFHFTHGCQFDDRDAGQKIPRGSNHIQFTRNTFELENRSVTWLEVWGDHALIDYNRFRNKRTAGAFIEVTGKRGIAQRTRIERNHFMNHGPEVGVGERGEAIRLGDSASSAFSARSVVESNLFERTNGDKEAISSKSEDNVIANNTILRSEGCISLRQADRNFVYGNFVANSRWAIRIFGDGHRVFNNMIVSTGTAITIGNGNVKDLTPDFENEHVTPDGQYDAPHDLLVAFNTLVDNDRHIVGDDPDAKRDEPPTAVLIANNIVMGDKGTLIDVLSPQGFGYDNNILWGKAAPGRHIPRNGYLHLDPSLLRDRLGVYRLRRHSPAIDAATRRHPEIRFDYDGDRRRDPKDIGADERNTAPGANRPLTSGDVGPHAGPWEAAPPIRF